MQVSKSTEDFAAGTFRNFVLVLWQLNTRIQNVQAVSDLIHSLAREHAGAVQLVQVVAESAVPPDADARGALVAMLRGHGCVMSASSVVQEGDGFRASMVRSIVTGLAMYARPGYPHKVFATVEEAVIALHSAHATAAEIQECVDQLRGHCLRAAS